MASLAASGPIELQRTSSASNAPVTAFDGWVLPDCTCETWASFNATAAATSAAATAIAAMALTTGLMLTSPSSMEHLDGLGLIASGRCQELIELNACLLLVRNEARTLKALGTGLCGNKRGEVDELARLQGNELIA